MSFRRSVIIAELWVPEVARRWKKIDFFAFLRKNDSLRKNFPNSAPKVFIATPIDVLYSSFVKLGRREIGKSCIAYLTKNKISPGCPAPATARIAPKICHGQLPTMYSECIRFHPNRFTFGGVLSELVNTVRVRSKANPIFGWSLASRRIKRKQVYYNAHVNFIRTSQVNI